MSKIMNELKKKHGHVFHPMERNAIEIHLLEASKALDESMAIFKERASATNWNAHLDAMIAYQYWSQKATYDEVEE